MELTRRLLSAARHAYNIKADGPVEADEEASNEAPNSRHVGYLGGSRPKGFVVGWRNEHAGLVGLNGDGVIIAIRGTTPSDGDPDIAQLVQDWIWDACIALTPGGGSFPGHVHEGFLGGFNDLWEDIYPAIHATVTAVDAATPEGQPKQTIYITGHSKGGAIAALAGWRLSKKYPGRVKVRTFAAPRVGDVAFAKAYNKAGIDHIRYEFVGDIVPHLPMPNEVLERILPFPLPPAALVTQGYGDLGNLRYIRADGVAVDESDDLRSQREAYWKEPSAVPSIAGIKAAHSTERGSGYCTALYP